MRAPEPHDPITGLPTRLAVLASLAEDGGRPTAVVVVDLGGTAPLQEPAPEAARLTDDDDLRVVAAAEQTRAVLARRAPDALVARLSCTALGVVVHGDAAADPAGLARALLDALGEGARAGAAAAPGGASARGLLGEARAALDRAVRHPAGWSHPVAVAPPGLTADLRDDLRLVTELRAAIAAGDLAVHYQPVVATPEPGGTARVRGAEALARWAHPTRGPVSPARFVALAEEHGLARALGEAVLRRAVTDLRALRATAGAAAPQWLSVNVSALQLLDPAFPAVVADVLAGSGLPDGALCLELTESLLLEDPVAARAALDRLRVLGVRVALDDFGSGYSSLGYLAAFPVDVLKLDRSFTVGLEQPRQRAVVRGALGIARELGIPVVAEGVETEQHLRVLRDLGCPLLQGYLTGRPGTLAALLARVLAEAGADPRGRVPGPRGPSAALRVAG